MLRIEALIAWGSLVGFVVLMVFIGIAMSRGVPNAVSCVDDRPAGVDDTPAGHTPAMSVQVTSNRNGHIVERNLFGCTFYSYEPPPGQ